MLKSNYQMAMCELESSARIDVELKIPYPATAHSSLKTFNMFFIYSIYYSNSRAKLTQTWEKNTKKQRKAKNSYKRLRTLEESLKETTAHFFPASNDSPTPSVSEPHL